MVDKQHLEIALKGTEYLNKWRIDHNERQIYLRQIYAMRIYAEQI
ncbi:MAG: hypothetical protein QXR63_02685 [Candidatus Bathyarchaeia archaeon]